MGKKLAVPARQFTKKFRIEGVKLAESISGNQVAKRLDVPDSSPRPRGPAASLFSATYQAEQLPPVLRVVQHTHNSDARRLR